jgi:hypothetical protein
VNYNSHKKNIYSQNGEDGVIERILKELAANIDLDEWCCEFGAWDGQYLSNTFALVENGYKAVYIESDLERFSDLVETSKRFPKVLPVNKLVKAHDGYGESLDSILVKTKIPPNFDILSIDVDSNDLDIWESLNNYFPKIVVIEINSSILPGIITRHSKTSGSSFSATLNVASNKGYSLVCHTGNLIFVKNEFIKFLTINDRYLKYPELLFMFESEWINSNKILYDDVNSIKLLTKSFFNHIKPWTLRRFLFDFIKHKLF